MVLLTRPCDHLKVFHGLPKRARFGQMQEYLSRRFSPERIGPDLHPLWSPSDTQAQ